MDDRHWLLRAMSLAWGLIRGFIAESLALAEENHSESESKDDFPTAEEAAGITIMMIEEDL